MDSVNPNMFDIMKGKYYESDYEEALIDLLVQQGWEYTHGGSISRNRSEEHTSELQSPS